MQNKEFENKMIWLIAEAQAMQLNFKSEINRCNDCASDFENGIQCFKDALEYYQEHDAEENKPMTSAEYKDYNKEEEATTGRED